MVRVPALGERERGGIHPPGEHPCDQAQDFARAAARGRTGGREEEGEPARPCAATGEGSPKRLLVYGFSSVDVCPGLLRSGPGFHVIAAGGWLPLNDCGGFPWT